MFIKNLSIVFEILVCYCLILFLISSDGTPLQIAQDKKESIFKIFSTFGIDISADKRAATREQMIYRMENR